MEARELKQLLDEQAELILVDVLPEEYFLMEHLPNARNACVYQVDFLDAMSKLAPDREKRVVVYSCSSGGLASSVAASKLTAAGWSSVSDFKGGVSEWRSAGYSVEGTGKAEAPLPKDRIYRVNTAESLIEWTGRNIAGKHTGTLKLSSGEVAVEGGKATSGHFLIDMKSINNSDLPDQTMAAMLVSHLLSEDFFEVNKHPEGRLTISSMEPIEESSTGRPNYTVKGRLKLKDVERPIEFPALVGTQNNSIIAQADFDIDRTEWNVIYGSGRFFENLGMHLVNDLVSIQLKIVVE